jgi:hypothetical protein
MIVIQVLGILGIFSFGYFVVATILNKDSCILEKISAGFLLGSGLFTFTLFLANWLFGVPFKTWYSVSILILLNIISLCINFFAKFYTKKKQRKHQQRRACIFSNLNKYENTIIALILILFTSSIINNLYWPVTDWDALALYDFRAKSFVATSFMYDAISRGYFTAYPLYTSLFHTYLYQINFNNPSFFYSILYITFVMLGFFISYRMTKRRLLSLLVSLFLAVNSFIYGHSLMSYTNLPYTIFLGTGFGYIMSSFRQSNVFSANFYIGVLLVSLSNWVRVSEPFWLIAFPVIIIFLIFTKKYLIALASAFSLYVIRYSWFKFLNVSNVLKTSYDTTNLYAVKDMSVNILDLKHIEAILYFYNNMVVPHKTLIFSFLTSLIVLVIYTLRNNKTFMYKSTREWLNIVNIFLPPLIVISFLLIMLAGVYLFMFRFDSYAIEIPDSAVRLSMVLIPITLLALVHNISFILKKIK